MDPIDAGEKAGRLLEKFIPPAVPAGTEEDARKLWRWRLLIAVVTLMNTGVLTFHIAWACSLLPGMTGFAMASEVGDIAKAQRATNVEILEARIFEMRIRQCDAAEKEEPRIVLLEYTRQLIKLKERYEDLTGKKAEVPECAEL